MRNDNVGIEQLAITGTNGKQYAAATVGQLRKFKGIRALVIASLLPEILYAWFTKINASDGIKASVKNVFGVDVPDEASDAAAWVFAALDFVINNILFNPNKTAMGAVGLEETKGVLYKELKKAEEDAKEDPKSACFIAYKFIFTKLLPYLGMVCNFPVGALADYLPLHDYIKGIDDHDWFLATVIIVATVLVVLGVSYYVALSLADVVADADSLFLKFPESPVAKLYRHSLSKGLDATISSLSTHAFRSAVFGFIAYSMANDVANFGSVATKICTGLGFLGGFEVSLLTRTTPSFNWLLGDNDSKAKLTKDDFINYYKPKAYQQVTTRLLGTFVGGVRAGALGWLTHYSLVNAQNLDDVAAYFVAAIIGLGLFAHGYWVHVDDSQKALALERKAATESATAQQTNNFVSTVLAVLFNLGSQAGRGFITVTSVNTLLGIQDDPADGFLNIMDRKAASVLGLFLALEVSIANFKYFHPKALKTIIELFEVLKQCCFKTGGSSGAGKGIFQEGASDESSNLLHGGGKNRGNAHNSLSSHNGSDVNHGGGHDGDYNGDDGNYDNRSDLNM